MATFISWLVVLDVARLFMAAFGILFTVLEIHDSRLDLRSSNQSERKSERLVAEANITNEILRLVVCVVFFWLAVTALMFPMPSATYVSYKHSWVMVVNRLGLILATGAITYKSWLDRRVRQELFRIWTSQRLGRRRRTDKGYKVEDDDIERPA